MCVCVYKIPCCKCWAFAWAHKTRVYIVHITLIWKEKWSVGCYFITVKSQPAYNPVPVSKSMTFCEGHALRLELNVRGFESNGRLECTFNHLLYYIQVWGKMFRWDFPYEGLRVKRLELIVAGLKWPFFPSFLFFFKSNKQQKMHVLQKQQQRKNKRGSFCAEPLAILLFQSDDNALGILRLSKLTPI